jgi:predicted GNAT family acetyltransferase
MEIQHEENAKKGEFYVDVDGKRLAKLQYFQSREGEIVVYHTEVDGSLSGQGIGKKLVAAVAEYVRKNGDKIHATCTYAHKVLSESDKYRDLLV